MEQNLTKSEGTDQQSQPKDNVNQAGQQSLYIEEYEDEKEKEARNRKLRLDRIRLANKRNNIVEIIDLLQKTTTYISRENRNIAIKALEVLQSDSTNQPQKQSSISFCIQQLQQHTANKLGKNARDSLQTLLNCLLNEQKYLMDIQLNPEDSEEIFYALTDDNSLTDTFYDIIFEELQAVQCTVKPLHKKIEIFGELTEQSFFQKLGGEIEKKYKINLADPKKSSFTLASNKLEKASCRGTVGGFAVVDGVAIALTAAHNFKISRQKDYDADNFDQDPNIIIFFNKYYDQAFFKLPGNTCVMNHLYFNGDPEAHDGFLDCFFEEFPLIDVNQLEPGTEIMKIGNTTGVTFGQFRGIKNVTFEEKGQKYKVKSAIILQWRPNQPFTRAGDSGSIYYAVKGAFRFPIAIHKGNAQVNFDSLHGQEKVTISFGTPFKENLMKACVKLNLEFQSKFFWPLKATSKEENMNNIMNKMQAEVLLIQENEGHLYSQYYTP